MQLGIGSYTYMWSIGMTGAVPGFPMTADQLLDKAIQLGVHVVQFGPNLPLDALTQHELDALLSRASTFQITIELGARCSTSTEIKKQLDLAIQTGARFIRIAPDIDGDIQSFEDHLKRVIPDLAEAAVTIGIENGSVPAKQLVTMLESIGSPWIGITLDTVNSLAVPEGPEEVISRLAPYVRCVHIKDFIIQRVWHRMGFQVEGRPAGSGMLDIPALLIRVGRTDSTANAILELWPPEQSSLEKTIQLEHDWAVESIQYLRRYIPS